MLIPITAIITLVEDGAATVALNMSDHATVDLNILDVDIIKVADVDMTGERSNFSN